MVDRRNFQKKISNKKAQRVYMVDGNELFNAAVRLGVRAAEDVNGSFDIELVDNYALVANYDETDKVIVSFLGKAGEVVAVQK